MKTCTLFRVNASIFIVLLYVVLYYIVQKTGLNETRFQSVSFFFLPAMARLMAALILGLWSIPALFVGGAVCIFAGWYDLGPGVGREFIMNSLSALGAPLGTYLVLKFRQIHPDLAGLTAKDLICLSAGCAMGNAVFLWFGFILLGLEGPGHGVLWGIFFGDWIGVWVMVLVLKLALQSFGRILGPATRVGLD